MNKNNTKIGSKLLQFVIIFKQQKKNNFCYWCGKELDTCQSCSGKRVLNSNSLCDTCKGAGVLCSVHKTNWG
jgi:DnaJ-class molecular chaperone